MIYEYRCPRCDRLATFYAPQTEYPCQCGELVRVPPDDDDDADFNSKTGGY